MQEADPQVDNRAAVVLALLEAGADVAAAASGSEDSPWSEGRTALHMLAWSGRQHSAQLGAVMRALVAAAKQAGVLDMADAGAFSPLRLAVVRGRIALLHELLNAGADPLCVRTASSRLCVCVLAAQGGLLGACVFYLAPTRPCRHQRPLPLPCHLPAAPACRWGSPATSGATTP